MLWPVGGKNGSLERFEQKLINGMLTNGHSEDFARRLFQQIKGFGNYGFPESHSASFALLVYISAWIKRFHPAAFYVGILNSQPMGFYSPSQLVQDAKRHGIRVSAVCINQSQWEHTLTHHEQGIGIRLGLRLVKGLSEESARRIETSRAASAFRSVDDVKQRQLMHKDELMKLVNANVFKSFEGNRRHAYWQSLQMNDGLNTQVSESSVSIKPLSPVQSLLADYHHASGVSLDYHPMQLLRQYAPFKHCTVANQLLAKR